MTLEEPTPKRSAIVMRRSAALLFCLALTAVLAFGAGWYAGRADWTGDRLPALGSIGETPPAVAVVVPAPEQALPSEEIPLEPEPAVSPESVPVPKAVASPAPAAIPKIEATPPPSPPVAPTPLVEPQVEAVVPIAERFGRAREFADAGDFEAAKSEVAELLDGYGDYSGLVAAFRESGADEVSAQLAALRLLQLGGLDSESVELARQLRLSYAGTAQVQESIHQWRILKPRVSGLEPAIQDGAGIVVHGKIRNPDIGEVRGVIVEVEALDAAGSVLATETTRVRPRRLGPGAEGSFAARFAAVNPNSVFRARATVVEWKSEVFERE